jgi:hypothetical protein
LAPILKPFPRAPEILDRKAGTFPGGSRQRGAVHQASLPGMECAARDFLTRKTLSLIDDLATHACADAEREEMWALNGHCNSPIAGFAEIKNAEMSLTASVLDHAGQRIIEASRSGPADQPREFGRAVGLRTLQRAQPTSSSRKRPAQSAFIRVHAATSARHAQSEFPAECRGRG